MEKDNLKSTWKGISIPQKGKEELNLMLRKNSHPVLAAIKKQVTIELIGFTGFLFGYFTMFDGIGKPTYINVIIIAAIALQLFYGYKGYLLQSRFKGDKNLYKDLENFNSRLKTHRLGVITARVLFAIGLIVYFTYSISFSSNKFLALAFIVLTFSVQLWFLYKVWSKRILKLASVLEEFKNSVI